MARKKALECEPQSLTQPHAVHLKLSCIPPLEVCVNAHKSTKTLTVRHVETTRCELLSKSIRIVLCGTLLAELLFAVMKGGNRRVARYLSPRNTPQVMMLPAKTSGTKQGTTSWGTEWDKSSPHIVTRFTE